MCVNKIEAPGLWRLHHKNPLGLALLAALIGRTNFSATLSASVRCQVTATGLDGSREAAVKRAAPAGAQAA